MSNAEPAHRTATGVPATSRRPISCSPEAVTNYTLLGVRRGSGNHVAEGFWLQHQHQATLTAARQRAHDTSAINGGMPVAVVEHQSHMNILSGPVHDITAVACERAEPMRRPLVSCQTCQQMAAVDEGVKISQAEIINAEIIAAWLTVLDVNSSGGQGVALKSEKPASVAFPDAAKDYENAKDALGWTYTKLPFEVARRMSSIPTEAAWKAKRTDAGDPPLMDADKAMVIYKHIRAAMTKYAGFANGVGNAASGRVLAALKKGVNFGVSP